MGWDSLSGHLIMLSFMIVYLMLMSSNKIYELNENPMFYKILLLLMMILLYLIFSSMNMMWFFIWFELVLIPMFILVIGWGVQSERFSAGMYLMFYTIFGSLPLLLGMVYLNENNTLIMMMMEKFSCYSMLWKLLMIMAFLIKLPMYLLHYWLPKAHVEAPVAGSMMLAGVLLKLGGYGLYRINILFLKMSLNNYIISISMIGGIMTSMMCLRQMDVKSLVAYSSVGHMGLMLSGLMSGNYMGFNGGIYMMIGHGMCSSGMFCIMNMLYERLGSRSLLMMKGFLSLQPGMMFWMFLILSSNMSAPPSLNLMSELYLIGSLYYYYNLNIIMLFFMFMLGCAYSLFLYSMVSHNKFWMSMGSMMMNLREMLLMFMHWFPLNLLFLKMVTFYLL